MIRRLVNDAINPALASRGLNQVDVRIGIDSGEAAIQVVGSPNTKQHKDLIGDVINLACKIEKNAGTGNIALGEITYRNLHTSWRTRCDVVDLGPDWNYRKDGEPYRVYLLR